MPNFPMPNSGEYWHDESPVVRKRSRKKKKKKKRDPNAPRSEALIQGDIVEFLRKALPGSVVAAVRNEFRRSGMAAMNEVVRAKGQGALTGFPDLIVLWREQTVLIEVKRKGGYPTTAQKEVHSRLRATGFRVEVMRSVEEAEALAEEMTAGLL